MREYLRAFSSELVKCRRTWAFTLATVTPAGVIALIFIATLKVPDKTWNDVWIFYLRGVIWVWLLMMTPFYVALVLAILAGADHRSGTWKVLLAQPVSRPPLYIAKLAVGLVLVAWSQVVLLAISVGAGFLLPRLRPRLGSYALGVDVKHLATMLAVAYASTLFVMAIHGWLTMRSANFVLSLAVVIFAEVVNVFALQQVSVQKILAVAIPLRRGQVGWTSTARYTPTLLAGQSFASGIDSGLGGGYCTGNLGFFQTRALTDADPCHPPCIAGACDLAGSRRPESAR